MIEVYTDACRKKTGRGGYGYIIKTMGQIGFSGDYLENITNNYGELEAAIKSMEEIINVYVEDNSFVRVHCDSAYFVNGFNDWIERWKNRNWTKVGGPRNVQIANLDQWKKLLEYKEALNVKAKWVRGHSGDESNEFCDKVANFCHSNQCSIKGVVPIGTVLDELDLQRYITGTTRLININ